MARRPNGLPIICAWFWAELGFGSKNPNPHPTQHRGSADLCVRPAAPWPKDTRPNGQPNHLGRKPQSAPIHSYRRRGPEPASRGGGPLCPLRCAMAKSHPYQWAAKPRGRKTPSATIPRKSHDNSRTDIRQSRSLKGNSSIAQGSSRSGYPGVGNCRIGLNPNAVRFRPDRWNQSCRSICAHHNNVRIQPAPHPVRTLEASPYRAESTWVP